MTTCESCGLPIPEAPLDVAAILAREPDGLPTAAIAKRLGRRKADVLVALAAEAEAGTPS